MAKLDFNMTGVHGGSNTYNSIIYQSFEESPKDRAGGNYSDTSKTKEIVDVVSNYPWAIDGIVSANGKIAHVPHCYAIEYQQRYASSMTNLINSFMSLGKATENVSDTLTKASKNIGNFLTNLAGADVTGAVTEVANAAKDAAAKLGEKTGVGNAINSIREGIKNTISNSVGKISNPLTVKTGKGQVHYLQPYSLLYDMTSTGLNYCFPMISNPPEIKVQNSYDNSQNESSILSANSLFSTISSMASSIANFNRDLSQFNSILSDGGTNGSLYERTNVEKSKFFQYPQQTETYTISFPLFNTVKSKHSGNPIWMKNYKFILLFCMRNMIFRKDNTSFYPPLFYDLTIPGVIHQPFTYVESVKVQPHGIVRMLECKKLFNFMSDNLFSVPVPEAWVVTITFKSLLATSANLVLSALDNSIVTSVRK